MSTTPQIHVLSDLVINKIAAGEVVERPASVVKEMMENAIDARATQVDVEVVAGGCTLVAVIDDGHGMTRDNALLAIERHATSKIRDAADIEHIATLGFRGEAMAAMASVSRFRLTTCAEGEVVGTELVADGGKLRDVQDIGRPHGATVEVRDLFFNVPARRKFLRSQQTELAHVRGTFIVMSLANPAVGMSLKVDGREMHQLPGHSTLEDRIRDLSGPQTLRHLRPVDWEQDAVRVGGYCGLPSLTRPDRSECHIFVNGRAASAPMIQYAIRQGYHTLLQKGRHPVVYLFVELDPELVDVNVHPTKREVRFRRPSDVRDAVIEAIRHALASPTTDSRPEATATDAPPVSAPPPAAHVQLKIDRMAVGRFRYPGEPHRSSGSVPTGPPTQKKAVAPEPAGPPGGSRPMPVVPEQHPPIAGGEPSPPPSVPSAAFPAPEAPWTSCRVVGQIGRGYVILETEEGYVVMDPRAAHERVLYERLLRACAKGQVESQRLLMPETVELGPRDGLRVRKALQALMAMGFEMAEFGGDSFVVEALPACLPDVPVSDLVREVAHGLERAGPGGEDYWREESVAEAASRAAVRGRSRLSDSEIEQLVRDLAKAKMPYTCPRGRPTVVFTPFTELDRKFGRKPH